MTLPYVFVETNFLIALLFPHLDYEKHQQASHLLTRNGTTFQLYIPFHSVFESLSTVRDRAKGLKRNFLVHFDNLRAAGVLSDVSDYTIEKLRSHIHSNFEAQRLTFIDQLGLLHVDREVFEVARNELIPLGIFSKKDTMDVYILASVLRKCEEIGDAIPKIFMSTNTSDFRDLPPELLEKYQIIYFSSFDVDTALIQWKERYQDVHSRL